MIPYIRNSRTHSEAQIAQIAASIKEFGFTNPVLIGADDGIIAGHGRVLAARKLNIDVIPCIRLSHLTEVQKRAYVIADNKLALNSGWDDAMLASELMGLVSDGFPIDLAGFNSDEFDELITDANYADLDGDQYTNKVKSPIYQCTAEKPEISELFDNTKTNELLIKISNSNLPSDEVEFLRQAAQRHVVFNYQNIAEYYAHSNSETQQIMEDLALVIIDFDKAIELGFVVLTDELTKAYEQSV